MKRLSKKESFSEENEKYTLFRGLMLWDIATDYTPRYWKVKNELNQVNKALDISTKNLQSLKQSGENAPRAFSGFESLFRNKEKQLDKLLNKISRLLVLQEKHIEKQAIRSLQQRYHQIENYHVRASYSLARLYDRMTLPENHKQQISAGKN